MQKWQSLFRSDPGRPQLMDMTPLQALNLQMHLPAIVRYMNFPDLWRCMVHFRTAIGFLKNIGVRLQSPAVQDVAVSRFTGSVIVNKNPSDTACML